MTESFNMSYSLNDSEVYQICSKFLIDFEITNIDPMLEGLSAYMLKVTVKKPKPFKFVLRVFAQEDKEYLEREIGIIIHTKKNDIFPVPNVLFIDNSEEIIPEHYYCYEYIEGETLANGVKALSYEQKVNLYAELGKIIGNMHLEEYSSSGYFYYRNNEVKFKEFDPDKRRYGGLYYGMLDDYRWALREGFKKTYSDYFQSCKKIWNKYKKYLKTKDFPSGLCHLDLHGDNLIIKKDQVQAFIDLEMTCYVDRHLDLVVCERGFFWWQTILEREERDKLVNVFYDSYQQKVLLEADYWKKRPAVKVVKIMDDLAAIPEYAKRLSEKKIIEIEKNLITELEELIKGYL